MNKTLGQRFLHLIQKEKKLQPSTSASNLPSISLNQLEKQVHDIRKRKNFKFNTDDSAILNNKQLNVSSPFYDRMKTHKQNCKCPYHRKKRFSVLPARHSVKTGFGIKRSIQKLQQSPSQNRLFRSFSKQIRQQNKPKVINKSFENIDDPNFSQTQKLAFKPKIQTRNLTYQTFLKECQFHLLRKKGFSAGKPQHVVRKGLKQIFQFINNHLDYSIEKMTDWVNGIEKDKDYGEFYIERFREIKKNYETGLRKKKGNNFLDEDDPNSKSFVKTCNTTGNNFKSKQALNSLYDTHGKRFKSMNNGWNGQTEGTIGIDRKLHTNQCNRIHQHEDGRNLQDEDESQQNDDKKMSQNYLNKIFDDLRDQNTISKQVLEEIMGLQLKSFKQMFQTLQNNIINDKYSDQILLKLESGVLSQLIKRSSSFISVKDNQKDFQDVNNPKYAKDKKEINGKDINSKDLKDFKNSKSSKSFKDFKDLKNAKDYPSSKKIIDLKEKLQIIMQTQNVIKKHRSRKLSKLSNLSEKASLNATLGQKQLLDSKRNAGNKHNQQNPKPSTGSHSKKFSNGDSQQFESQKNLLDSERNQKMYLSNKKKTRLNKQQIDFDDQDLTEEERKRLKALGFLGPHARRSKLQKFGEGFNFLRQGFQQENQKDLQFRKYSVDLHRGYFTKAEKYLFEINMGKTIIKNDDSIFTAKRKMRVIKLLLKQTPNAPEADALKNYVKQVEQKIWQKTQKQKKLAQKNKALQNEQIKDQDIWKSITLDNLGFQLIFYNISSKFKIEDNDDLCILLNEWKLNNIRRLENKLSFKMNLVTDDDELRKSKKKSKKQDTLVQDGMRNMEFEPQMDSEREMKIMNQSKRTTRILGKTLIQLNNLAKDSKMSGFFGQHSLNKTFTEEDLQGLDEQELRIYYAKIKEMFKYAKVHLPETFDRYIKNSSQNYSQINFDESQMNFGNFSF